MNFIDKLHLRKVCVALQFHEMSSFSYIVREPNTTVSVSHWLSGISMSKKWEAKWGGRTIFYELTV